MAHQRFNIPWAFSQFLAIYKSNIIALVWKSKIIESLCFEMLFDQILSKFNQIVHFCVVEFR